MNAAVVQKAIDPVRLLGRWVCLEPMVAHHAAALAVVGLHPELWRLQPRPICTHADMVAYVAAALSDAQAGLGLPFVICDRQSGEVIGSTRFMDIALAHRRLEIGATWITPRWQRTQANTEAKLLLLSHAFESLAVQKVVFKTEVLNTASANALARIGATQEGVFRQHLIADSGRVRDMVYFSILSSEWPTVKAGLLSRLAPAAN